MRNTKIICTIGPRTESYEMLKTLALKKQLVMITHLRSTIALANTVHGVRTRWDGSSFMKFYFVMDERLLRLYKCC